MVINRRLRGTFMDLPGLAIHHHLGNFHLGLRVESEHEEPASQQAEEGTGCRWWHSHAGLKQEILVEKWSAIKHDRLLLCALLNPVGPQKN